MNTHLISTQTLPSRRAFIKTASAAGIATITSQLLPSPSLKAAAASPLSIANGPIDLSIAEEKIRIGKRWAKATTVNGGIPGPLIRLKEGHDAVIRVHNRLNEDSSIHWHGLILDYKMDGVPGLSFPGIPSGEAFEYRFPVNQNGTYWYHSHSGLQEQTGVYGPLIIDAMGGEPWSYDREYVILLSDWTFLDPHTLLKKLKKEADYSNYQQQTLLNLIKEASQGGFTAALKDRLMWSQMRMMPTDIADVTGHHYSYLTNGLGPDDNWTGIFQPGERIRLRFVNASSGTYFDVRIPGLPLTIAQADGQNVEPVEVDEFRMAIAETYDVIVQPTEPIAYTIFAEAMDRSGYARATLAPRAGLAGPIPERRARPLLTMKDMGMGDHSHTSQSSSATHSASAPSIDEHSHHLSTMKGSERHSKPIPQTFLHGPDTHGPGNASVALVAQSRLDEPGLGLDDAPWRVLTYADLVSPNSGYDLRKPSREIEIHLTGNMERYMWSFDGEQFSMGTAPIRLVHGERVRLTFVNDTMMNHPIHLHGMWMVLDNGHGERNPRKHTINVKPAERLSADVTVDAPGNWAFHCHILFHMEMGMFRVVSVSQPLES